MSSNVIGHPLTSQVTPADCSPVFMMDGYGQTALFPALQRVALACASAWCRLTGPFPQSCALLGVAAPCRGTHPLVSPGHPCTILGLFLKAGTETSSDQECWRPVPALLWTITLWLGQGALGLPSLKLGLGPTLCGGSCRTQSGGGGWSEGHCGVTQSDFVFPFVPAHLGRHRSWNRNADR